MRVDSLLLLPMTLLMPRPFATKLLFEALKSPDEEICGLVGADDDSVLRLYPISNIAADPRRQFEMDPQQQIASLRRMREHGEDLLAIYHSHPDTPPEPSARDLEALGYPDAIYLIISLNIKGVLEMRGFKRVENNVQEVSLKVMA